MRRVVVLVLALGGCAAPLHLSSDFGVSTCTAFERQIAHPGAVAVVAPGLDSQEAAIISKDYRLSLSPQHQGRTDQQPILYVGPSGVPQAANAMMPPPSVPPDQER